VPRALALAAVVAVAAVSLPLVYLVIRAAGADAGAWDVVLRARTVELVLRTGVLVAAVTAAATALGVPLAWLVARTDLPGRRVWGVLFALPIVIPSYVTALAFISAFGPRGLLQTVLEGPLGIERVPEIYGFPGAFVALTLATYPYVYLLVLAALRRSAPALEDASRSLGSGPWATFRRITLPALRSSIGAGALLAALYALSDFGVVSLMRYEALTRAIFQQYRGLFDRTPAALLSLVLVALTAIVLVLEARAGARTSARRPPASTSPPTTPLPLGRWKPYALGASALLVAVALLVPIAVLGYWGERALVRGDIDVSGVADAALHSLIAAALAAGAAVLAALPVAALAARHPRRWTAALERLSYASNALPGIVIALALVFFAARYATAVYQTLALLVFAYVVRFFPQALAGAHSALVRVDPRLEEIGRGLGRSPRAVFATVTVPLVVPGLLAGATLVFLSTMKELPATLLLRPIGFETLATEVWAATSVASYSQAAVPALLLIVLSAPIVWASIAGRASADPEVVRRAEAAARE
jgi:iron(III) transport system permease protein